jgi:hypothetical protein
MKNLVQFYRAAIAAPILLAAAACNSGEMTAHDQTVIYKEAPEFLEAWVAARAAGDGAVLRPMYTDQTGFVWVQDGTVFYDTADDAAASLDFASTGGYTPELKLNEPKFKALSKNAASVWSEYTETLTIGADTVIETKGIFTGVLVKEDGQWKFMQAHFGAVPSDLAIEAPPEPVADETAPPSEESVPVP